MASNQQRSGRSGVLSETVVESISVQERHGSLHVTIPKQSARDLGIQKGDNVIFAGEEGNSQLVLQLPDQFLSSGD